MAKVKKGSKETPLKAGEIDTLQEEVKPIVIVSGSLSDGRCNYSYMINTGKNYGDTHNVKGKGIIDPDLEEAFKTFHVHLAAIDEIFKHSETEINDIDLFHDHEFTDLFRVTAFKMKVSGELEQISLSGTKYSSSSSGWLAIDTHKISLDPLSSYKWYNELKAAADKIREEVELYANGKCTPEEKDEEQDEKYKQLSIVDAMSNGDELDEDFKDAEV